MKQRKNKQGKAWMAVLVACVIVAAGIALVILLAQGNAPADDFVAEVSCAVVEESSNQAKTNVCIQNTGTTFAYMRVEVVVTWKSEDGKTWPMKPMEGVDYSMQFADKTGWVQGADGFYYYTSAVAPLDDPKTALVNETLTGVLISHTKQLKKSPDGFDGTKYSLSIEIIASAIQAESDEAVGREWSNDKVLVTAKNGTLTILDIKN